jgi:hypothetical protein
MLKINRKNIKLSLQMCSVKYDSRKENTNLSDLGVMSGGAMLGSSSSLLIFYFVINYVAEKNAVTAVEKIT